MPCLLYIQHKHYFQNSARRQSITFPDKAKSAFLLLEKAQVSSMIQDGNASMVMFRTLAPSLVLGRWSQSLMAPALCVKVLVSKTLAPVSMNKVGDLSQAFILPTTPPQVVVSCRLHYPLWYAPVQFAATCTVRKVQPGSVSYQVRAWFWWLPSIKHAASPLPNP